MRIVQQMQTIIGVSAVDKNFAQPNLPCQDLINGSRIEYLNTVVPLYEASINCDWKAAKSIFDQKPELVRYAITENCETALHVSASAKGHKKNQEFVQHLVSLMTREDLELQNKNHNTAFYLAAAAGNITTVKIIMAKNKELLIIPGAGGNMMPLYTAALFGYYDVVKYLYKNSHNLWDCDWDHQNRRSLLEKCIENDMFDIAIQIVEQNPELASNGNALRILARKSDAFCVRNSFIWGIIISVFVFFGLKKRASEKETKALSLLKIIWESISKMPKNEIDKILRGPPDSIDTKESSASRKIIQAMQVNKLISRHLQKLDEDTRQIIQTPQYEVHIQQLLTSLISEHIVNMHLETQNIFNQHDKEVSSKVDQALQKCITELIVSLHVDTHNLNKRQYSEVHEKRQKLEELISKHIREMHIAITIKETHSSQIMFTAAEMGNTNFLVELIRQYPDMIWKVDDNNQTIFHIAVKHRHAGIYNLLFKIGAMKDIITPLKDEHDNNMLHLVGMIANQKRIPDVSGVALQMQREILWFREVSRMIPPSYREWKNADNLTPHELFINEHQHIVRQDEKWMKEIAGQCMVVAALIATMVFTAAFTVPGGYNQDDGIPIFYLEAAYKVFVVTDAISLLTSTTSILYMFVSVFFASNYREFDFLESLPRKLILGLLYLSVSIVSMLISFCVGFFILYHNGLLWMPILISTFALNPVYQSTKMFFLLLGNVIRFEYGSRNLFTPK